MKEKLQYLFSFFYYPIVSHCWEKVSPETLNWSMSLTTPHHSSNISDRLANSFSVVVAILDLVND